MKNAQQWLRDVQAAPVPERVATAELEHAVRRLESCAAADSERALADCHPKRIDVTASATDERVRIRVTDTGPGLASVTRLFEPFQLDAESTGLGLYLSRALLRSFGGDLQHDATVPGCSFVIELQTVPPRNEHADSINADGTYPVALGR